MRRWPIGVLGLGIGAAAALTRAYPRIAVRGRSMAPGLLPGDRLLIARTRRVRPGELAIVRDPREPSRWMVKRVRRRLPDGAVEVRGDNPSASTDSRTFGIVPRRLVVGRPLYRYHPPGRVGPL